MIGVSAFHCRELPDCQPCPILCRIVSTVSTLNTESQHLYSICDPFQRIGDHASRPALACCLHLFRWKRSEARHEYAHPHRETVRRHRVPVLTGRLSRSGGKPLLASALRYVGAVSPPPIRAAGLWFQQTGLRCGPDVFWRTRSSCNFLESLLQKGLSIEKVRSVSRSLLARQRPDYSECAEGSRTAISKFGKRTGHIKVVRNV